MAKPEVLEESLGENANDGASTSATNNHGHVDRAVVSNGHINVATTVTFPLTFRRRQPVEEVQDEGQELFVEFLQGEIDNQHVQVPNDIQELMHNEQHALERHFGRSTGTTLRQLADEFAKSEGRQRVREVANKAKVEDITFQDFLEFLQTFFVDDENPVERIVTLFYFCSDMIINSIKKKLYQYTKNFLKWSLQFILQRVCIWVAENGGWNTILGLVRERIQKALMYIGVVSVITAVVSFGIAYFWRGK